MGSPVKSRRYVSPRREAQAAETRRAVLDAARRLFEDGGYAGTAVPSVAAAAGVAVKTVYLAFETKAGLLRAVWEARLGGEEEATPVLERRWMRELTDQADPAGKLQLLAAQSRRVKTATGPLLEVIRTAAATDAEIATLWQDIEAKLLRVQRAVVDQLAAAGALRPPLQREEAADVLWTLNHPSVWHLLVRGRRWSDARYERWLYEAACLQLLGTSPPR
ncbi:TetR/AcrR family transcriptional regulator [Modestobacter sp. URMC 112]